MRFVILPQAIKNILPAIANEFVTIIKESSICYTIGVQEIMYAVSSIKGATYRIAEPLVVAACVLLLPDVPHQQDHRLLRKENEPWRPEIS
mgnify:CR=1 FL=1